MLLWLQKNLPKSIFLLGKLLAFSTSFHIIILFTLFFIYKGENNGFNFQVSKDLLNSDTPVVFLPFYKRIAQPKNLKPHKGAKKKQHIAEPILQKEKKEKTEKIDKATTIVQKPSKKAKPKKEEKKVKQEQVKVEPAKLEQEKIIEKEAKEVEAQSKSDEIQQAPDDVRYVGRDDLNSLQMQEFVNQEISTHWNPPIGVPENTYCEIKLVVDWQGALNDCKIIKPSKVVIFNISARKAVKAMTFPKWLWGKEFTITFQQ